MTVKKSFASYLFRALVYFLLWVGLSGKFDQFHLMLGLISALIVASFTERHLVESSQKLYISKIPGLCLRAIGYGIWLLGRIILAAVHVSKIILSPRMPLAPKLFRHDTVLREPTAKVIFANSITLTPGTITADLEGNTLLVHALDEDSTGDITGGKMESEIHKIFGGEKPDA